MGYKTPSLSGAQHPCARSCQPARDAPEKGIQGPGAGGLPWGAGGGSPPDAWELTSSLAARSQRANAPALITLRLPALFGEQNLTQHWTGKQKAALGY